MAQPGEDPDKFDFYNPETQKIESRPKHQSYSTYLNEGFSDSDKVSEALFSARKAKGFKTYKNPIEDDQGAGSGTYSANDD